MVGDRIANSGSMVVGAREMLQIIVKDHGQVNNRTVLVIFMNHYLAQE